MKNVHEAGMWKPAVSHLLSLTEKSVFSVSQTLVPPQLCPSGPDIRVFLQISGTQKRIQTGTLDTERAAMASALESK